MTICETGQMPDHPGRRLRDALDKGTVIAPGAFNGLVARAVADAGFEACYISGGATANVAGYPDIGLITLSEMCRTIREVTQACGLPAVVDADTGYGEVESVVRTVVEYGNVESNQRRLDSHRLTHVSAADNKHKRSGDNRLDQYFL